MENNRFIPIDEIIDLMIQRDEINKKIDSYNPFHCKECGDTKPKQHFDVLLSSFYISNKNGNRNFYKTSPYTCNRCKMSDEQYEKVFKEPKEII